MDRIVGRAKVERGTQSSSKLWPRKFHSNQIRDFWQIPLVLTTTVFIAGTIALVMRKVVNGLRSDFTEEKENPMSSPAKAEDNRKENRNNNRSKTPLLETLLDQDRSVDSTTDDLVDQARTQKAADFSRTFEKRVGGLSGFGAPLVRPSHK